MRLIAISLSPNTEKEDTFASMKMFFTPWRYNQGKNISLLEQWFRRFFKVSYAISFTSGRGALYASLKAAGVTKGDEVITQAFTCVALPDAIIGVGAKPVYADITQSFTLDPKDVEKKITPKTKAIIAQHSFGIPSPMEELLAITKKHKLILIEDCAHVIGGMYDNKKLGTFGDIAFFSFGRDKAFSSVWGGIAITNHKAFGEKLRSFQRQREFPSVSWTAQQLLHPVCFAIILPLYNIFSLGKVLLLILQRFRLLSFPVSQKEKQGQMEENTIKKLPNALAFLALLQVNKLSRYNKKRIEIGKFYEKVLPNAFSATQKNDIPFLRFPLIIEGKEEILRFFRKKGIYIGNWYSSVIDPRGVLLEKVYYKKGMCPLAEELAAKVINLPTYPTMEEEDTQKIVTLMQEYVQHKGN